MRPVICMVTDRRRLGADGERTLAARVGEAARAGAHLIQIRETDLDGGPLFRLVSRCVEAVAATRARIIVNDRLDVALAAGAHGVHLRGTSTPAARVRPLTPPGFLIGRSVHSHGEAARVVADGALDYLIFGTVFATASKPGVAVAGLAQLAEAVTATTVPTLAIGGMTPARLEGIGRTGAAGFAAVGLFAEHREDELRVLLQRIDAAFDMSGAVP